MSKIDLKKQLEDINEQETMIKQSDGKIKMMIERDGVNRMLEKHVETRSDDYWKKIIEDFQKIHENEERMERQLELEEIQRLKEETRKLQEANKQVEDVNRQIEQMNQVMKQGIKAMLANGMSLELISKSLSKSEDEIIELLK
ncbi:hypothetical protein [uncultured Holdemanella sp.]|uniref:hypothetical protein n=1 Tax=uncultured Holdemanella sp. TaxID=1763549 RepID=UPI002587DD28|nr:hypothetical protein [uncultured Holdemanella sp.]